MATLYEKFASELHRVANESPIKFPIASVLIENRRMVSRIRNNTERSSFHGAVHSSLHAEMNTILDFHGGNIQWDRRTGRWKCGDGGKER
jgi:tRNA(Arg) A34 adenosine deaminase TadA